MQSAVTPEWRRTLPALLLAVAMVPLASLTGKGIEARGTALGGTEVTLRGEGFDTPIEVTFGRRAALRVVTPPADAPGVVDVTVTVSSETATLAHGFELGRRTLRDVTSLEDELFALRPASLWTADPCAGPSASRARGM
jgi:hypothetical protein